MIKIFILMMMLFQLKEGEERKEGETEDNKDDIVYADLDKSAMSDGK